VLAEVVQRRLILEAATLFRTRGTLASLERMVELLTDAEVVVIEQFRLRGGGVVGNPDAVVSQAVLGGGYRVGGMIGEPGSAPIEGAAAPDFDDFAHRFTVTVVAALDDAQLACVRRLIELHKPAHTDFTLCNASAGMRAGVGANVGISTVVGRSGISSRRWSATPCSAPATCSGRPALDPGGRAVTLTVRRLDTRMRSPVPLDAGRVASWAGRVRGAGWRGDRPGGR